MSATSQLDRLQEYARRRSLLVGDKLLKDPPVRGASKGRHAEPPVTEDGNLAKCEELFAPHFPTILVQGALDRLKLSTHISQLGMFRTKDLSQCPFPYLELVKSFELKFGRRLALEDVPQVTTRSG